MLIHYKPTTKFAEIFQENNIQFSLVNKIKEDEYEELHYRIKCRDFLNDAILSENIKEPINFYGFSWKPGTLQRDKTRLLVYTNKKTQIEENLTLLNKIELENKISRTKLIKIKDFTYLIIGSPLWNKHTWTISLYSFLIKAYALTNDFNKLTSNEGYYWSALNNKYYEHLLANLKSYINKKQPVIFHSIRKKPNFFTLSTAHDKSGIVSLLSSQLDEFKKHFNVQDKMP